MKQEDFEKIPFLNEYEKMLSNIYFTHIWLFEKYQHNIKKFDITVQQWNVLGFLHKIHPASSDLQTIKRALMESKSDATRLIERLKKKGLLTTRIDPGNKRKIEIRLTKAGKSLSEKIAGLGDPFIGRIAGSFKPEEAAGINAMLDKLRIILKDQ